MALLAKVWVQRRSARTHLVTTLRNLLRSKAFSKAAVFIIFHDCQISWHPSGPSIPFEIARNYEQYFFSAIGFPDNFQRFYQVPVPPESSEAKVVQVLQSPSFFIMISSISHKDFSRKFFWKVEHASNRACEKLGKDAHQSRFGICQTDSSSSTSRSNASLEPMSGESQVFPNRGLVSLNICQPEDDRIVLCLTRWLVCLNILQAEDFQSYRKQKDVFLNFNNCQELIFPNSCFGS